MLHTAILEREEQGETLSRLLPGGLADEAARRPRRGIERTERLTVTVLMSDVRGYSGIAEHTDPAVLAGQLNAHRDAMNAAILDRGRHRHAVRRGRGHGGLRRAGPAAGSRRAAPSAPPCRCTRASRSWTGRGPSRAWQPFGLGIGLSTGEVAAACSAAPNGSSTPSSATP